MMTKRDDKWRRLHRFLVEADLERWRDLAVAILREVDPKYELEPEKWWMAGLEAKTLEHSARLRKGVAEGIALIGAMSDETDLDGTMSGQDWACVVVRDILVDADWMLWASLSGYLALLAEACPDVFLKAVERDLDREEPALRRLFAEPADTHAPNHSPHPGLLFALECLARTSEHVTRAVLALARLAELDPGGRTSNRPLGSIISILRVGFPQTAASWEHRASIFDTLRRDHPDIAWETMIGVLPTRMGFGMPSSRPRWRRWPVVGEP